MFAFQNERYNIHFTNKPKQTDSKVLSMFISQTFHKGESEVEPRVVFVEISILKFQIFMNHKKTRLSLIGR